MKTFIKSITAVVFVLLVILGYQNCSSQNGFKAAQSSLNTSGNGSGDLLDNGVVNQAPRVNCKIIRSSDNVVLRVVDTISSQDTFNQPIVEGDALTFDCTASSDDLTETKDLKFEVNYNTSSENYQSTVVTFNHTFSQFGTYPMAIRITDKDNRSTIKAFTAFVQCSGSRPALVIDTTKIKITSDGNVGYFNYDASGAVSGGSGNYKYSWDFNGDGIYDLFDIKNPVTWTQANQANHVYTSFGNQRKVALQVLDSCNVTAYKEFDANFDIPRIAPNSQAVEKPYYYLQADVRPLSTADKQKTSTVDFIGTQLPGLTEPKRVTCDYKLINLKTATAFNIKALNTYDNNTNPSLVHGMKLDIANIIDDGSASQSFSSNDADASRRISVSNLDYLVSEKGDGKANILYRKTSACTVNLRLKRAAAVTPCSPGGSAVPAGTVTLLGEYSCPNLAASGQTDLSATNGYFFCEVSYSDQCVGGGGGGGGQPPNPQ